MYALVTQYPTATLHSLTAVAELKQLAATAEQNRGLFDLHSLTAVAELKQLDLMREYRIRKAVSTASRLWPN